MLADEKRSFQRNLVNARVRLTHSAFGSVEGRTRNLSDSGAYIVGVELPILPRGAHICIQFLDSVRPDIMFNTKVIESAPDRLRLTFVDYEVNGKRHSLEELKRLWSRR